MAPLIQADFSEAVEFEDLPAGTYKVRVTGCEPRQTQKGETRLIWKLTTFGNDSTKLNNRVLFHGTMTSGKGAGFLKSFIKAATGEEPVGGAFDSDQLLGRELVVTAVPGRDQHGNLSGFPEVKSVASLPR